MTFGTVEDDMDSVSISIFTGVVLVILSLFFLLWRGRRRASSISSSTCQDQGLKRKSVLIVVGSGGHTREMLELVRVMGANYQPRYYIIAETDTMSKNKVLESEKDASADYEYAIFTVPRSREVKQSYLTSVLTTVKALIYSFPLVWKTKPDVILCNGPGTCIPVCVVGLLFKLLTIHCSMIVYVESICRVKSLSMSGKFLYHFADAFFVQWPELQHKYPKSKYVGRLV